MDKTETSNRGKRRHKGLTAQILPAALTVNEFCAVHRISRSLFYLLQRQGSGPRLMRCRGKTLIAVEAAADWRRLLEQAPPAARMKNNHVSGAPASTERVEAA